ncbi:MAG TPA: 4-hydroxy-tetrahydrodipicolinate reductase [Acidimicrobiales bacterium]|nr:4-hydroxy-tetrahydrodipicolinate reductase [Acidimicrobiales bacterium]
MTRVGVVGAGGRMGREVCRAVAEADDLELVAAVDPGHAGSAVHGCPIEADVAALSAGKAEVVVDFTVAEALRVNLPLYASEGVHAVVGTTGLSDVELEEAARLFGASAANAIVAANFTISAVLLMHLCALAAPFMESAEVIELHHDAKRDAPSGTALRTASAMADARDRAHAGSLPPDPTTDTVLRGARGGQGPGGIHIHSVRLPGLVAHQEVIFGAAGQSLTIRQDSYDRRSYMPGVLLAVRHVADRPGLTIGIESLLGL